MKKLLAFLTAMLIVGNTLVAYSAEIDATVEPVIQNGEALFLMDELLGAIGAEVTWDDNHRNAEVDFRGIIWACDVSGDGESIYADIEGAGRNGGYKLVRLSTDDDITGSCEIIDGNVYLYMETASWLMFSFGYTLWDENGAVKVCELIPNIDQVYRKMIEKNEQEEAERMAQIALQKEEARELCANVFENCKEDFEAVKDAAVRIVDKYHQYVTIGRYDGMGSDRDYANYTVTEQVGEHTARIRKNIEESEDLDRIKCFFDKLQDKYSDRGVSKSVAGKYDEQYAKVTIELYSSTAFVAGFKWNDREIDIKDEPSPGQFYDTLIDVGDGWYYYEAQLMH